MQGGSDGTPVGSAICGPDHRSDLGRAMRLWTAGRVRYLRTRTPLGLGRAGGRRVRYLRTRKPLRTIQRDPAQPWTVRYPCRLPFLRTRTPLGFRSCSRLWRPDPLAPRQPSGGEGYGEWALHDGPQVADPRPGWEKTVGVRGLRATSRVRVCVRRISPLVYRFVASACPWHNMVSPARRRRVCAGDAAISVALRSPPRWRAVRYRLASFPTPAVP